MTPQLHHVELLRYSRDIAAGIAGGAIVGGIAWWIVWKGRPSAEEVERRRRQRLGTSGRIVDGMITGVIDSDGQPADGTHPHIVLYGYSIGGVAYECAQDVSPLSGRMLGFRIDLPVQVKYDPRNPYDSIIVSEEWKGFRSDTPSIPLGA